MCVWSHLDTISAYLLSFFFTLSHEERLILWKLFNILPCNTRNSLEETMLAALRNKMYPMMKSRKRYEWENQL